MLNIRFRWERVPVTTAAQEQGLSPAAARTCGSLLSGPGGGLYLDVKSAYSSAADILTACGVLAGMGVQVKVCEGMCEGVVGKKHTIKNHG